MRGGAFGESTADGPCEIAVVSGLENIDYVDGFEAVQQDTYMALVVSNVRGNGESRY